jgi:hypothetical protein
MNSLAPLIRNHKSFLGVHGPMTHQDMNLLPYFLHVLTHKYLEYRQHLCIVFTYMSFLFLDWFIFKVVFLFLNIHAVASFH